MAQIIFDSAQLGHFMDASDLGAGSYAVMRGGIGDDIFIGSNGADRLAGGAGYNMLDGRDGNDMFFATLSAAESDVIQGGNGEDTLNIALSSAQLANPTIMAALISLNTYLTSIRPADPEAVFHSDVLHLDMREVEHVSVRLDGAVFSLDQVGARALHAVNFEDVPMSTDWSHFFDRVPLPAGYAGYDWTSANGAVVYAAAVYGFFGVGPGAGDGVNAILSDAESVSPLVVTKTDGGTFRFGGASVGLLSDAAVAGTDVTFTGTKAGEVVGTFTIHATNTFVSDFQVDWAPIDHLTISTPDTLPVELDRLWLS